MMTGKYFLSIGIVLGIILIGLLMFFYGYTKTWRLWNIPTMAPYFLDSQSIASGAEYRAQGGDPLIQNPLDPHGRPLNYPRIWQKLYLAGINKSHAIYFGVVFASLFFISLFLFIPATINFPTSLVLLLSIFSPVVLLGVERGNSDLFIFFLLSCAIILASKKGVVSEIMTMTLLLFSFILKLYPLFGVGLILNKTKQIIVRLGIIVLGLVIIYVMANYHEIVLINHATPRSLGLSYGLEVLWPVVNGYGGIFGTAIRLISYMAIMICLIVVGIDFYCGKYDNKKYLKEDPRNMNGFRVGSGIYIGTFLLLNNFEYRLIFLLFIIPQLMLWSRSSGYLSIISRFIIANILIAMWSLMLDSFNLGRHTVFFITQFSTWIIFLGNFFLFFHSLPEWMKPSRGQFNNEHS